MDETQFKKKMDRNLSWDGARLEHFKEAPADWDYHQNLALVEEMNKHADYWLWRLYYYDCNYYQAANASWYDEHWNPLDLKLTDTDTAPKYQVEGRAKLAGRFGLGKEYQGPGKCSY